MPTRLAILADVHVDGEGPRARLLADAVARIQKLSCDGVVLLGDTVERGLTEEYRQARLVLKPIQSLVRPMMGNHEVLEGTRAQFRAAWHVEPFTADLIDKLPVMRFDSAIPAQPEDEYFGTVTADQLKLCDAVLSAHRELPALIFSHHPLASTVRRTDEKNLTIENSDAVRQVLSNHPRPKVIFSGHTHAQSVYREPGLTAIGCPPLGYWPHAFLVVDVSSTGVRFETHQLITSPSDSPDPDAMRDEYRSDNEGSENDRAGTVTF